MELNFLCSVQCLAEKSAAIEDSESKRDKELVELDPLAGGVPGEHPLYDEV